MTDNQDDSDEGMVRDPATAISSLVVTRSEEELHVGTVWAPYRRVRVGKRVVTEIRTVEVELRREELFVEEYEVSPGSETERASDRDQSTFELTLHEEQLLVTLTAVPVENVRVTIEPVTSPIEVSTELARERILYEESP